MLPISVSLVDIGSSLVVEFEDFRRHIRELVRFGREESCEHDLFRIIFLVGDLFSETLHECLVFFILILKSLRTSGAEFLALLICTKINEPSHQILNKGDNHLRVSIFELDINIILLFRLLKVKFELDLEASEGFFERIGGEFVFWAEGI